MARSRSRSARTAAPPQKGGGCFLVVFGSFFALAGLAFLSFAWIWPNWKGRKTESWTPTACEIVSSDLGRGEDSYFFEVEYAYKAGGQLHASDQHRAGVRLGMDRSEVAALVQRYPVGSRHTCFVDPHDPEDAVLEAGAHSTIAFLLLPGIFVLIGVALALAGLFGRRRQARQVTRSESLADSTSRPVASIVPGPTDWQDDSDDLRSRKLQVAQAPRGKALLLLLVALFWNGVTSPFVYFAFFSGDQGGEAWFLRLFVIPFVLVGVGLLYAFVRQVLVLFGPSLDVWLVPGALLPGEEGRVGWACNGDARRISSLRVTLTGREKVTWRAGTSTYSDEHVFHEEELFSTDGRARIEEGETTLSIPAGAMHTFRGDDNQIVWSLRFDGEIRRYPDLAQDHPFDVPAPGPIPHE